MYRFHDRDGLWFLLLFVALMVIVMIGALVHLPGIGTPAMTI